MPRCLSCAADNRWLKDRAPAERSHARLPVGGQGSSVAALGPGRTLPHATRGGQRYSFAEEGAETWEAVAPNLHAADAEKDGVVLAG